MEGEVGKLVLPGFIVRTKKPKKSTTIIGHGLQKYDEHEEPNILMVTRSGILRHREPNIYWVDCRPTKYIPKRGDFVIGIITRRLGECFRVDIGAAESAVISSLAFEGATKKRKIDITIGDAIYAKVLTAYKETEPYLVCVDKLFKADTMGKLPGSGFILRLPIDTAYKLLDPHNSLLKNLGKSTAYEIAVGINGRVWINARTNESLFNIMKHLECI